jgi:hypothetical protein
MDKETVIQESIDQHAQSRKKFSDWMTNTSLILLAFVVNIAVQIQLRSSIDNSDTNLKTFFYLISSSILAGILIKAIESLEERFIFKLRSMIERYEIQNSLFQEQKELFHQEIQHIEERIASVLSPKYDIESLIKLNELKSIASHQVSQFEFYASEAEDSLARLKNDIFESNEVDMKLLLALSKKENIEILWTVFTTTQIILFSFSIEEAIRYFWTFLLGGNSTQSPFSVYSWIFGISLIFVATIVIVALNPASPIMWNIGRRIVAVTKRLAAKISEVCRSNMGI